MSTEYFRAIIDCMGDPVFVKDRDYKFVFVNDAACEMFGKPREQVLGKTDYELFSKEQADVFRRHDDAVFETGKADVDEGQVTDAQGNVRSIITKKVLYVNKAGEKYIVGVLRDITERKRSEEALRAEQLELSEVMDLARVVYWESDPVTSTYLLNDPFYAFYGTTAEQAGGYRMTRDEYARFIHPDDRTHYYQFVEQGIADPDTESVTYIEYRVIRGDGEVRHVLGRRRIVRDDSGRIVKKYGAIQDITERKQAEEALKKSEVLLRSVVSASPVGITLETAGRVIIWVNKAIVRCSGYRAKELEDESARIFYASDEEFARVGELVRTEVAHGGIGVTETKFLRKDGQIRDIQTHCRPGRRRGCLGRHSLCRCRHHGAEACGRRAAKGPPAPFRHHRFPPRRDLCHR